MTYTQFLAVICDTRDIPLQLLGSPHWRRALATGDIALRDGVYVRRCQPPAS